jgi:hypothetical protein
MARRTRRGVRLFLPALGNKADGPIESLNVITCDQPRRVFNLSSETGAVEIIGSQVNCGYDARTLHPAKDPNDPSSDQGNFDGVGLNLTRLLAAPSVGQCHRPGARLPDFLIKRESRTGLVLSGCSLQFRSLTATDLRLLTEDDSRAHKWRTRDRKRTNPRGSGADQRRSNTTPEPVQCLRKIRLTVM